MYNLLLLKCFSSSQLACLTVLVVIFPLLLALPKSQEDGPSWFLSSHCVFKSYLFFFMTACKAYFCLQSLKTWQVGMVLSPFSTKILESALPTLCLTSLLPFSSKPFVIDQMHSSNRSEGTGGRIHCCTPSWNSEFNFSLKH